MTEPTVAAIIAAIRETPLQADDRDRIVAAVYSTPITVVDAPAYAPARPKTECTLCGHLGYHSVVVAGDPLCDQCDRERRGVPKPKPKPR